MSKSIGKDIESMLKVATTLYTLNYDLYNKYNIPRHTLGAIRRPSGISKKSISDVGILTIGYYVKMASDPRGPGQH